MSGTFEGVGTLQFTPDNKFAYAYGGVITTSGTGSANTTLLEVTTESYYLDSKIAIQSDEAGGATEYIEIRFNDQTVLQSFFDTASGSTGSVLFDTPFYFIIPPFTKVTILGGVSAGTEEFTAQITAKVGMGPRVGNLDE